VISYVTTQYFDSAVEYGFSPDNLSSNVAGTPQNYTFGLDYTSPWLHHLTLDGLKPETRYFYRVGTAASGLSSVRSFVTPPAPSAAAFPLKWAVMGDLGQTTNSNSTVQHILGRTNEFVGILHAGDLSYADFDEPRWDSWGVMVDPLSSQLHWMTTCGNHEIEAFFGTEFVPYQARYHMPLGPSQSESARNLFYSFEVGPVHVIALSSYSDFSSSSEQYAWLQSDLATIDRSVTPWVLVMLHAPWYNSNYAHHGEGDAMKDAMESLLFKAGVDAVMSGHVHAYERVHRVYQGKLNSEGPHYLNIGDGGNREGLAAHYYDPQPDWSAFRQAEYGHAELTLVNATHAWWEWHRDMDPEPVVTDSTWIIKGEQSWL
jgi:hypothetical protein